MRRECRQLAATATATRQRTVPSAPAMRAWPLRCVARALPAGLVMIAALGVLPAAARPKHSLPRGGASPAAPSVTPAPTPTTTARDSSGMVLRGDQEGTAFRSLTVQGEDRVHFDIERPSLDLAIDPTTAPGLDRGSAEDVLNRTIPDGVTPFLHESTAELDPFLGRPWLRLFASGDVARFHPQLDNVVSWRLLVANSRGEAVASFEGKGKPPRDIAWNGRGVNGQPAEPGMTYSYVLEARDRAGNKRNFVGPGFELPAYRLQGPNGLELAFVGDDAGASAASPGAPHPASGYVLEAASWLDQSSASETVRVTATARSFDQANGLATGVARALAPLLLGNPGRVQVQAHVAPDACPRGTVRIATAP